MQHVLFAAPHRVMFLVGAVQAMLAILWWSAVLASRVAPHTLPTPPALLLDLPPAWTHASLMLFGCYPFFIFGFLMTAMPRWQGAAPVPARVYILASALMCAGWLCFYIGFWLRLAAGVGLALVLAGWLLGVLDLLRVLRHPNPERRHAMVIICATGIGGACVGALIYGLLGGRHSVAHRALDIGIWWFLLPIFVTVSHRMIPFFSGSVLQGYVMYRPYWMLYLLLGAFFAHAALALLETPQWLWVPDSLAALAAVRLSVRWKFARSFAVRLLAMLHLAFLWLGISLALFAVQGLAAFAGRPMLGWAPLHAMVIGFFGSMLIAMASRVTLGHSGQALAADKSTWLVFLGIQAVALIRICGEITPGAWANHIALVAACAWLLVFGIWFIKFAPSYWRPRKDALPG